MADEESNSPSDEEEALTVENIPVPATPQAVKSSDEILSELFGAFNAKPPPLDNIPTTNSQTKASDKSQKRHKKNSKHKKVKKRKRSSSSESKSTTESRKKVKKSKKDKTKKIPAESESVKVSKKKKGKLGKFSESDTDDEEDKPSVKRKKSSKVKTSKKIKHDKVKVKLEKDNDKSELSISTIPDSIKENILKHAVSKIVDKVIDSTNLASEICKSIANAQVTSSSLKKEILKIKPIVVKQEKTNDREDKVLKTSSESLKCVSKTIKQEHNQQIQDKSKSDKSQQKTSDKNQIVDTPPVQPLSVADVFAEDLLDCGVKKDSKAVADKPKPSAGKITIQNLKFSQVYKATVKQIEDEAKQKAEKYEEGELSESSAEPERSPSPSETSSDESVINVEKIKICEKKEKSHRHRHKREKHHRTHRRRHRCSDKKRSKSEERHERQSSRDRSRSPHRSRDVNKRERTDDKVKTRERAKRERSRSKDRSRSRDRVKRQRSRSKERSRSRDRSKRERSRSKERSRSRDRSKRERSRSKERSRSRDRSKRERSRSKERSRSRDRSKRERSRSKETTRSKDRAKRERSPERSLKRSRRRTRSNERNNRNSEEKIDKQKLLEIARKNALNMLKPASTMAEQTKVAITSGGRTVNELTDFCKLLSKKDADGHESISSNTSHSSDSESEKPFHHPFQIKDRPSGIVLNIRNSVALPVKSLHEKTVEQSRVLRLQFPVSSGQHHRKTEKEWIPVSPKKTETVSSVVVTTSNTNTQVAVIKPTKQHTRAIKDTPEPPNIDIGSIVSLRLNAMRRLQENPTDSEALTQMYKAQKNMQNWAESKQQPLGQFTGSTGAKVLSQAELSSGYQAWARRDQLQCAAPVSSGMGMALLQKMGWRPGEGLGKNKEGALQPLLLEVKMDKKGLVAQEELPVRQPHQGPIRGPPRTVEGKHPVSLLNEYCGRRKFGVPVFELIHEAGPDHKKNFLFKVIVNSVEYKPAVGSPKKKTARAEAAEVCLRALGVLHK